MSLKILATIEGCPITEEVDGCVHYIAKAAVDTDGSGPLHGDPCAQRDTSLHVNGKPLNADIDCYIVVPPVIRDSVRGIVLGCMATVKNLHNGKSTDAVVGDIGPRFKLGEVSVATAAALGLDPSPNHGGTDSHCISYTLWPGVPAHVHGKTYPLQAK